MAIVQYAVGNGVLKTLNDWATFTDITPAGVPSGAGITVNIPDKDNPDRVIAAGTDFIRYSTDQGATWSANQRVTTAVSDESTANAARNGNNYGEYLGSIALGGTTFAAWTDARAANFTAGTNEDVEAAATFVDVSPVCDANGPYTAECAVGSIASPSPCSLPLRLQVSS